MTHVDFEFKIKQKVKTPFGNGIVRWLAVDDTGKKQINVMTEHDSRWYHEDELEPIETPPA